MVDVMKEKWNFTIVPDPEIPDSYTSLFENMEGVSNYSFTPERELRQNCWSAGLAITGYTNHTNEYEYYGKSIWNLTTRSGVNFADMRMSDIIWLLSNTTAVVKKDTNLTAATVEMMLGVSPAIASSLAFMSYWNGLAYGGDVDKETNEYPFFMPLWVFNGVVQGMFEGFSHVRRSSMLPALFLALTIVTGIVMGLRFWSRREYGSYGIRSYDWMILVGWFLTVSYGAVAAGQTYYLAKPTCDSTVNYVLASHHFFTTLDVLYPIALLVIKSSLLLFYYRLSDLHYMRMAVWATFFFVFVSTAMGIGISLVTYTRDTYFRDLDRKSHENLTMETRMKSSLAVASATLIIATDLLIWLLPLPLLSSLQLSLREKMFAVLTFGLGTLACIASGFRLQVLLEFLEPESNFYEIDLFSMADGINIWGMVELNTGILCASVPALRVLANRYLPKLMGTVRSVSRASNVTKDKKDILLLRMSDGVQFGRDYCRQSIYSEGNAAVVEGGDTIKSLRAPANSQQTNNNNRPGLGERRGRTESESSMINVASAGPRFIHIEMRRPDTAMSV